MVGFWYILCVLRLTRELPPFLALSYPGGRFHQHFKGRFFVRKCYVQLFSTYSLCLCVFVEKIWAKKFRVKCWWNWPRYLVHKRRKRVSKPHLTCSNFTIIFLLIIFSRSQSYKLIFLSKTTKLVIDGTILQFKLKFK